MSPLYGTSGKSRTLEAFLLSLRKELAARFRLVPSHPGIERILEEIEAHLEDTIAELVDHGATNEAATTTALSRFGTASRVARAYGALQAPSFIDPRADAPRWHRLLSRIQSPGLTEWLSDLRVAIRGLARSPGYALAFVLTLGLGIGANTAIFSVVNGIWLRPLPYRDGDRLVYLRHSASLAGIDNATFSVPEIDDYRQHSPSLEGVAEFSAMTFTLLGVDEPRRVRAGIVTGNYFEVMGLGAHLGRVISNREDGAAAPTVAVLTYDYWHRLFGADPAVVGRTVTIDDRSVENIVPSIAGAALGVLLAVAGCDLLASYIARYSTRASEITVDTTMLGVALVVAFAAASFFAFLPRLPGTASRRLGWFSGTRSTAGVAGRRIQRLLVVSQVGVSFVLLVGAGLSLDTLKNLQQDTGGVALEEVLAMNVPISYGTQTTEELFAHHGTILERVAALPGVRSAALGSMIPLKNRPHGVFAGLAAVEFEIEGQPTEPGAQPPRADFRIVSGSYFHTLGMTLVQGRTFQSTDTPDGAKVVVVNQALADHYFPDREVVGQRISWRGDSLHYMGVTEEYRTIVGVVSDVKDYGVAENVPHVVFNPFSEVPLASSLFVRTAQPDMVVRPILDLVRELDPEQPVVDIATLAQIRSESISPQRLNATLVGAFAFLALTVAAVGVAGVLAFGVSQRTHEFGVRAALGADRSALMRVVLKEGVFLALFGLAIGLAASLLLAGLISGLLHEVTPTNVGTLGRVAVLLTLVALLASAVPAWRASEIDPVQALREE